MTVAQKAAILVVLAMIGAAGVSVFATSHKTSPPAALVERAAENDPPGVVTVHVAGLVNRPGVYQLPAGTRILDAITAAGGVTSEGDASALNLASILADGQRIDVAAPAPSPLAPSALAPADAFPMAPATVTPVTSQPGQPPTMPPAGHTGKPHLPFATKAPTTGLPSGPPPPPGVSGGPVSLSRASIEDLERIPRVGPGRAQRIVYYRAQHGGFKTVNELDQVPGFGPKLVEDVRPYVVP